MSSSAEPKPPSTPHPGERLASYFDNFFKTILGIATLGASITFSKIVQTPVKPWIAYGYSKDTIQFFLAISWLLFVLALAFTSVFASLFSLYKPMAVEMFGTKRSDDRRKVMWVVTGVSLLLFGLVVGAFCFVSLVVVGYAGPVGYVTLGFCGVFGSGGVAMIVGQSPLFMRNGESDVLSPVVERRATDMSWGGGEQQGQKEKGQPMVQEGEVGRNWGRNTSAGYGKGVPGGEQVPGYREEWRYSRRGELRVQEFNNRSRKGMYDAAYQ